ncbi:potassium-transporting ATPase subunit KdpC [Priestia taiwanensis]|uniref:Potassium-transporting ATPase KdpC subunit n=1 Tax=Priestia taiwanensis TaxID=1347902 RepID=A0A917ES46_9BACI|nr:potassium-transporting ATPase subunit KdpC [Priestia taiwanensis]MBM7364328.1 K+-transporting ATPase ATPase C chain [Priestia taiwanensis]GGE73532.1 potassium-transporting ATPase KdpC subunit [Priestia taiwanensis]
MNEKQSIVGPILRLTVVMLVLCCFLYPLAVTGVAQAIFPAKAEGSFIYNEKDEIIGSELIGQQFTSPRYFHGRVSSVEYKGDSSGSNNYAPSNKDLVARTEQSLEEWKKANPTVPVSEVPIDLVTNSGSGLDPHISPAAAYVQVEHVAKERGMNKATLNQLVAQHIEMKDLGLFGEDKVNVLKLNVALDQLTK